jgi:hypothetical protein
MKQRAGRQILAVAVAVPQSDGVFNWSQAVVARSIIEGTTMERCRNRRIAGKLKPVKTLTAQRDHGADLGNDADRGPSPTMKGSRSAIR